MIKQLRIFLTILFCLGVGLSHAQSISGKVFNDANNNGIQDGAEVGYPFVVVNAYAPGSTTPTATTATTGSPSANAGEYALAGLSAGVQYRIEFVTPTGYHDGAFSSLQGHSSVQFATTGATGVNYGIRYANECTISSNPRLIGSQSLNPTYNGAANGVLKSWSYSDRVLELQSNFQSAGPFPPDDLTYTAGTGTPTGVSFDSKNKHIYFSSWAAMASIFPAPTAGYHAIQIANYSGAGNTFVDQKTLVDLATIGLSTTALNQISTFPTNSAGTAGLGQVAVSGDGKFLYGVNLNDGSIFKLNISNVNYASLPTTAPTSTELSSITIPSSVPNPVGGVFRPFALKLKGNTLYIGGINDASTSLNNANLEMVVLTMDLSTNSFTKIFSHNLNFTAGITQNGYGYAGIFGLTQHYWRDAPSVYSDFQPFFNSIEFDDYGAMLIGITNRVVYTSMSGWQGGYFVRAARNSSGGYTLENAGFSDPFTSSARGLGSGGAPGDGPGNSDTYNTDGPGGKFFYENMIHDFHANVFIGGLYVLPGSNEVVAGVIDPISFNQEGARYLNASTGVTIAGKALQSGKAGTMTGTEAVCDPNPVEIGNRLWRDTNGNGIQDGDEPGVGGATIVLCETGNNTPIATAVTDGNGNYIFSTAVGTSTPSSIYGLALNLSGLYDLKVTSLGSSALLTGYALSNVTTLIDEVSGLNSGSSPRNSDAILSSGTPMIQIKLGSSGENNYTYDFGFYKAPCNVTPSVIAGSQSICLGENPVAFTETTAATGSGTLSYQWQQSTTDCTTGFSDIVGEMSTTYDPPAVSVTTYYHCVVTNTDGANTCSDTSNCLTVTVNALPSVDAGSTKNLDCSTTSAMIGTAAVSGNTYAWLPVAGLDDANLAQPTASPTSTTTYTVTVAGSNGCTSTASVTVNVNTTAPTANAGPTKNLDCTTTSSTIGSAAVSGNTYSWSPTTGLDDASLAQPTASPTSTTIYTVTVTGSNGCAATASVTVNVNTTAPTADAGSPKMIDCNVTSVSIGSSAISGNTYAWLPTAGLNDATLAQPTASPSATTTYTVSVTGTNGCVATSTVAVTVNSSVGTIGNYVWNDMNNNGLNDENTNAGLNAVTVELWKETSPSSGVYSLSQTTSTDYNGGNPGYYSFTVCENANYKVKFPVANNAGSPLTQQTITAATDNNSDANLVDGFSPVFAIDINGTGTDKDNMTIDAGYYVEPACLGNYVWNDMNKDGIQNNGEVGVAGITVSLLDNTLNTIGSTITDAYGFYQFCSLIPGTYSVTFTLPSNYTFTSQNSTTDEADSDVDPITGITTSYVLAAGDSNMTADAGIYFEQPITASVGNYVWLDVNQNGIQDNNEQGISGVTVTLYNSAGDAVATMPTNANGFYLFTNVTPGSYSVGFTAPVGLSFTVQNGATNNASNSDADPSTGVTASFTVNAGDEITYVDAGLFSLPQNVGSLGNRVWYDEDQDGVQDATETGVNNVIVTLYQQDGTTILNETVTDAYGNYIFNNLPQGSYVVGFSNLPINYVFTTTSGADSATNSDANIISGKTAIIYLAQGQHNMTYDAGIYTTQSANTNSIGNYVWLDLNKDGVQDMNEPGYAGITATLYSSSNVVLGTTSTDASGYYLFPNLPNGDYYVGFSNLPSNFVFTQTGAGTTATDSDPDLVTGFTGTVSLIGNTHDMTLDAGIYRGSLRIGIDASLGDLVWYDMNNNGLQDNDEQGVQGVTVTLYESNGTTVISTTTTNALGNYIFTGLQEGAYIVGFDNLPSGFTLSPKNADAQGLNGEANSDVNSGSNKTDLINLGEGEDKMSVDMGITPPAGTAGLGNYVWMDLNNDGLQTSGEPGVQGIGVTLYDNTNTAIATTTTDANGAYSFVGLTPGTYSVGFDNLPSGFGFTTENSDVQGINGASNSDANASTGLTTTVTLTAGDYNPNLDAGIVSTTVASVGDYVWFDMNQDGLQDANEPGIGGVLVTLYNSSNTAVASTITRPDGSYIFTNVTPGDYTMGFSNIPSGMEFTQEVGTATDNNNSNVNPSTGLTATFTVVAGTHNPTIDAGLTTPANAGLGNFVWYDVDKDGVQDSNEPGIAGATVTLYAQDGTTVLGTAITDGNGAYTFTNLQAGQYSICVGNVPYIFHSTGNRMVAVPTAQNAAAGTDETDSDINPAGGCTMNYTLAAGEYNPTLDAGFVYQFAVPVVMKDFTVLNDQCNVFVNWVTSSEKNTSHYNVMRTSTTTNTTTQVAQIMAKGSTQSENSYSYTDREVTTGSYTYHLEIVDIDGQHSESDKKGVEVTCSENDKVRIYPNPVSNQLNVRIESEESDEFTVNVRDVAGRIVLQSSVEVNATVKIVSMNMSELANGTYSVEVIGIYQKKTFKVLLSK